MAALDGDLRGKRIAYSPDFGVYPVDPRVAAAVASAVRGVRGGRGDGRAGRHLAAVRPARARRPVVPHDRAAQHRGRSKGSRRPGSICSASTATRCRPSTSERIEAGIPAERDRRDPRPAMRTEVSRRRPGRRRRLRPPRDAHRVGGPGRQRRRRRHRRATRGRRRRGRSADRVVHDVLPNFSGHPAASIPAGLIDEPAPRRDADHRRALRRRGVLTASRAFEQVRPWDAAYQICRERPLA